MKRIWLLLIAAVLAFTMGAAACDGTDDKNPTVNNGSYLTIEDNYLRLTTGENFTLTIKKTNSDGIEENITSVECLSDAPLIAVYENGVIVAKKEGKTYLHFTVDGIKTAVFVEVNDALSSAFMVKSASAPVYKGVPVRLNVFFSETGSQSVEVENVAWSVSAQDASIENGVFTAQRSGDIVVTANFTYGGVAQTIDQTIVVYEPITYAFSTQQLRLATTKTLSGEVNDKYISCVPTLTATNILTGETTNVDASEYVLSVEDETIAAISQGAVCSSGTTGVTQVIATLKDSGRREAVSLKTATAIAEIKDMDILSLACHNQPSLLEKDYVLTNDIDYKGDVIMPIAPFNDGNANTRYIGIQWKYRLEKDDKKYKWVERDKFGEENRGLSDQDFATLANAYGINGLNKYSFSGSFDGNGYSIKNAALFYGIQTGVVQTYDDVGEGTFATYSHAFGYVTGTIKNLGFENLKVQDPKASPVSLDVAYIGNGNYKTGVIQKVLKKVDNVDYDFEKLEHNYFEVGSYYIKGVSVIGRGIGCTVENVYVDVTLNLPSRYSSAGIVIALASDEVNVENCAVALHTNDDMCLRVRALSGEGVVNAGTFKNNIVVGEKWRVQVDIDVNNFGENGNWWTSANEWSDLFNKNSGANAKNVRSLQEVLASFDSSVWDVSALQTNVAPKLKNGCSFAK